MSVLIETCTLSNGNQIPKIGFGTWLLKEGPIARLVPGSAMNASLHAASRRMDA